MAISRNYSILWQYLDPDKLLPTLREIPVPSISFYRNGRVIDESTDMRITLTDSSEPQDFLTSGGTAFLVSRNLTLDNTMDTDSSTYTCAASNVAGNVTRDFELVVQGELLYICFIQWELKFMKDG